MGIKTGPHYPCSPSDFWLFPKLRACRNETIRGMKEAVTNVIDTLTQEDFPWAFQKFLERYNAIFSLWVTRYYSRSFCVHLFARSSFVIFSIPSSISLSFSP